MKQILDFFCWNLESRMIGSNSSSGSCVTNLRTLQWIEQKLSGLKSLPLNTFCDSSNWLSMISYYIVKFYIFFLHLSLLSVVVCFFCFFLLLWFFDLVAKQTCFKSLAAYASEWDSMRKLPQLQPALCILPLIDKNYPIWGWQVCLSPLMT